MADPTTLEDGRQVEVVAVEELVKGDVLYMGYKEYTVVGLAVPGCSSCAKSQVMLQVEERSTDISFIKGAGVARIISS